MVVVNADKLCKTFQGDENAAIESLSFSIQTGKITGLVGPDGAGKTTLMRILAGLLAPSQGDLHVLDTPMPCNKSDFLQQIGYMPQKFGLYEDLSIDENLRLYASLQNIDNAKTRIEELLEFTRLTPFRKRKAGDLSGGMKQKLGLACALIKKPKLLLLDEPGVGVDPISRRSLWAMVQKLLSDDIAVLWGTSYLDEADRCTEIILLNEGKSLYQGTPSDMKRPLAEHVYLVKNIKTDKRTLLSKLLESSEVLDAVLVGDAIRVNLYEKNTFPAKIITKENPHADISLYEATFEDAFVKLLNVKTPPHSLLAQKMSPKEQNKAPLIEATHLTKKFGDFTATDDVSFTVKQGEIFGFLGPNGAGKSTTFKMLCGLLGPTQGSALVMGDDLYHPKTAVRTRIGYMAQKFSLYGTLNVKENLEFFAGLYGLKNNARKEKINEIIETFDFHPHLKTATDLLPLGIKQRLALSCALMHEPNVLFLDEPTSGVDPITRKEFWVHINEIVKKGVCVMVTTHFMDEAEYCDRIMLIYQGKAIATGTPDELKHTVAKNATMEETFIHLIESYDKENGA
jgi:ABC-2 type transport system ATP-binding protein